MRGRHEVGIRRCRGISRRVADYGQHSAARWSGELARSSHSWDSQEIRGHRVPGAGFHKCRWLGGLRASLGYATQVSWLPRPGRSLHSFDAVLYSLYARGALRT